MTRFLRGLDGNIKSLCMTITWHYLNLHDLAPVGFLTTESDQLQTYKAQINPACESRVFKSCLASNGRCTLNGSGYGIDNAVG